MKVKRMVVVALVAAGLAGCAATTGRTAGRTIDDANITAAVKTKLAGDSARTLTAVDVDTVNGIVYLTGTVPDADAKRRAERLAESVDGVARVENNLQTTTAADAPTSDEQDGDQQDRDIY